MVQASRIVSLINAKGGTGASVLAANLAVGLSLASKTPTLLLDLDLNAGGSQASLFSLEQAAEQKHLGQLLQEPINVNTLEAQLLHHDRGEVHLLAAPPVQSLTVLRLEQLYELLLVGNALYRNIVIDVAQPRLNEVMGVCLDCSSMVLPVVIPDIVSLQATSALLREITQADFSLSKFELLLNMANLSQDLLPEDIGAYFQQQLKRPLSLNLPYAPAEIIKSVNRGVPVLHKCKTESLVNAFVELVRFLLRSQTIDVSTVSISYRAQQPPEALPSAAQAVQTSTAASRSQQSKALMPVSHAVSGWSPEQYRKERQRLHDRLLQEAKLHEMDLESPQKREQARQTLRQKLSEIMVADKVEILSRKEKVMIIEEILDEALGLGPLEPLLKDESVTEIMVNGPEQVFIERHGKIELSHRQFLSERQLRVVIDRIVSPLGRRIDESSPMVDARLPDGSRVNVIIPPLALDGATITIRKFPAERLRAQDLINIGSMTPDMAAFLRGAVQARLNILICGGTGSGKTTLLNVMSSFIPPGARIVTIEDAAELQLDQQHVIRLESRPANMEGKGHVSIRDLVRNSLRMRPDRIVVGEVRGGEALDMLQAMNTGHDGSLTTCHANAPREALSRLETMVLMAGVELPVRAIREQITSAVDLIVHQSRLRDGTRKIMNIVEVSGMEGEIITTQEIFKFEQMTVDDNGNVVGRFVQNEIRPGVLDRFVAYGVAIPECFGPQAEHLVFEDETGMAEGKGQKKGFFW
ncbi:MAG: Flp pilus assembly complex ATPase component TadA [Candidatus Sericytochromatia bacterium]|nr:Flp pilus assembly complex ATPase component TadA [Candidatus Sericytochromatia bacterium]